MRRIAMATALLGLVFGCGGGDDGGGGGGAGSAERPLEPTFETTEWTYHQVTPDGDLYDFPMRMAGEKELHGRTYGRYQAGSGLVKDNGDLVEAWVEWRGEDEVVFGGGEIRAAFPGISENGEPLVSGSTDEPVVFDLFPPVGEPQVFDLSGTVVLGGSGDPIALEGELTYTLVETDVTVNTSAGPIAGCRRFEASGSTQGQDISGECWYHPELGLVAADVDVPPPGGVHLDLLGIEDWGDPAAGWGDMQGMAVLDTDNTVFRLDTYDVNGAFDADKNTHAKMLLEFRWVDETLALGTTEPPVTLDFGTTWGYYPAMLVQSPVSIFHPDENGQGYTYWVAAVDQAAKNQPENGISYHASASLQTVSEPVRVSGRLLYKRWK